MTGGRPACGAGRGTTACAPCCAAIGLRGWTSWTGPASLLWHSHDAKLARLRSFLVRGDLVVDGAEWVLTPRRMRAGPGMSGPLGDVAAFRAARRRAGRYLAARGLARPQIPWDRLRP